MDAAVGRRALLRGLVAGGLATLAGCASTPPGGDRGGNGDGTGNPDGEGPGPGPSAVGLEPVVTDLTAPVAVAFDGERDRTYVAELGGRIVRYDGIGDGNGDGPAEDPVLELGDAVEVGGERGLLGIALHPTFPDDPRLFVRYSAPARPGTPSGFSHTFVLSSFELVDEGRRAAPATERAILELPQPQSNHNAGDLAFGPDGDLYVPTGDGGAAGDRGRGHVEDWYDAVPGGNGQDVEDNLLGSVLRIDVDVDVDVDGDVARPYAIPEDNPLVDGPGCDEHYAWGFRNPWRLSFDDDDLFVADVGQDRFEEVNLVERGGNYGWNVREGEGCYGGPSACPSATPGDVRGGEPLREPIVAYPHDGPGVTGISVIGGYVYRGEELPELDGTYVFGDLDPRGRLLLARPPGDGGGGGDGGGEGAGRGTWSLAAVDVRAAGTDGAGGPGDLDRLLSFGRDGDGEVYVLGTAHAGEGVYRLVPVE